MPRCAKCHLAPLDKFDLIICTDLVPMNMQMLSDRGLAQLLPEEG